MPERFAVEFDAERKAFMVRDRQRQGRAAGTFDCTYGEAFAGALNYARMLNDSSPEEPAPEIITSERTARFLTVKEFSALHGVSEWTVRRWVRRNGLPHVRLGEIRIPQNALDLLHQTQSRTSETTSGNADIVSDIPQRQSTAPTRRKSRT